MKKIIRPDIPRKAIYRLSVYLRCLQRLKANGIRTVSSETLAKVAGVKSTQLRKDLAYFGQFGVRGLGYDVGQLAQMTSDLLGTNIRVTNLEPGMAETEFSLVRFHGDEDRAAKVYTGLTPLTPEDVAGDGGGLVPIAPTPEERWDDGVV